MHQYSIDRNSRTTVNFWIVVISIGLSVALSIYISKHLYVVGKEIDSAEELSVLIRTAKNIEILPNLIGAPALFCLLSKFYNEVLWRTALVKKIHKVPDLNGKWEGQLHTNYLKKDIPMKLEIEQTWTHIRCTAHFGESNSYSNVAAIYSKEDEGVVLYFAYRSESKDTNIGNQMHIGYNKLILEGEELNGIYCNNRESHALGESHGNIGSIELKKI